MVVLNKAILAAHILGVKGIRVFAFSRVEEPESVLPKIAEVLQEMAKVAEKEGVQLLIENEASCNVGTSAELKRICAFPDDFQLTGTYAQQWERLGRAVPPLMMKAIAQTIRDEVLLRCVESSARS